ncbi:MAG: DUF4350 domain-containing protein [Phycisphaerae bacterium]|nr:DUF4350 domain-containing protein [Phycisphaerae bacterium]
MVILVLLIVTAMVAVAAIFHKPDQSGGAGTFASSYSHTPGGLLAVFRLLARHGPSVPERMERPWTELGGQGDVLIVAGPLRVEPTATEIEALSQWIARGNTLVYLLGQDRGIDRRADRSEPLNEALELDLRRLHRGEGDEPFWLLRDLVLAQGSAFPALPSDLTRNVRHVATFSSDGLPSELPAPPLLEDHAGRGHLVRYSHYAGQVVIAASGSMFSNRLIGKADNVVLLLNVLEQAGEGGRVLFDEYHHGYYDREPLTTPYSRRVLIALGGQMFLLVTMFLMSRGRRFGPLKSLRRPVRRSHIEFVEALAELYRRGGAGGHAAARLYDDFREQVIHELHLPRTADAHQMADALAGRTRRSRDAVRRILIDAQQAAESPRLSSRRLLAVARQLAHLSKEVLAS